MADRAQGATVGGYTVTITKRVTEVQRKGHKWEKLGARPMTRDEVETENRYGKAEDFTGKIVSTMGYTPYYDEETEVEREVFKVSVDDLDFEAVVRAVYGLGGP